MSFKVVFCLLCWLSMRMLSQAETSLAEFVAASFGTVPPVQTLRVQGDVAKTVSEVWGSRYPHAAVSYWRQAGQTVWVLKARGKTELIDVGFVIEAGHIVKSEVQAYRETRGKKICSSRFLKQFSGVSLKKGAKLSRRINGYSGATLSVNAVRKLARTALVFDSFVSRAVD